MRIGIRTFCTLSAVALLAGIATAQPTGRTVPPGDAPAPTALNSESYRLWSGRAPDAKSDSVEETPTLTLLRPQGGNGNGTAVVIAPGGAYIGLATVLEGVEPARWFTTRGVTVFLLSYRVGPAARLPIPLADGPRAIRFVRARASEFGIDPSRIGMMGFSAGGHLAATTAVEATAGNAGSADPIERVSSRPDFLVLGYPWLEGMQLRPDGGSSYCDFVKMRGGGGPECQPKDYAQYLPLRKVAATTPPTFIYHTTDDGLVPAMGSVRFYEALTSKGVSAEMHLFQTGPHGTGLGGRSPALAHWPELLEAWMRDRQLLNMPPPAAPPAPPPAR